ncbi:MAG: TonB-dependent receptor [Halioglobus sp.]
MSKKMSCMALLPMVAAVAFATNAHAQRTISAQLEEVIVTAEKREKNMQDVAISVSAIDAKAIEKMFARDISDLAGMAPNLIIDPILGNGTAAISIRGMQLNDVEKSFDPAVAVYQDGIYLATSTGALLNTWDAERIEVLRGPQGTLFGRNTIGGLIHVIRNKPTGEWGGKVSATFAEDDQQDYKGTIDFPAFANISTKLTAMDSSGGDYFDNKTRNKDEGGSDLQMWSFAALWEPTDSVSVHFIYDDIDDDTPVRPVTCLTEGNELFSSATLLGLPTDDFFTAGQCANKKDEDFHRDTYTSSSQDASVEVESYTINASWEIGDAHKLVLVYGDREMEETSLQEFDGFSFDAFRVSRPQTEEQQSLELRLESDFSWGSTTFGGFYWESEYDAWQNTFFFAGFDPTNGTNPLAGFNDSPRTLHETENTAFFGQVDWNITDRMTLTLGGRYTDEEKTYCQMFTVPTTDGDPQFIDFDGNAKDIQKAWGNCPGYASEFVNNNFTDPATGQQATLDGKQDWSEFSPKAGLSYDIDAGLVFLSYTEGFRSGGFNGRATSNSTAGPYDPETVESWELGFKTTWLDNTLQFNGAIFTTDYQDKQEDVVLPGTDGAVTLTVVQNAAGATLSGAEFEVVWIALAGLTLNANLGYLDAEYDDYTVTAPSGNPVDKSGFDLRKAPELNYAIGALYEFPLSNGHFLVGALNYRWKDDAWNCGNSGGPKHFSSDPCLVDSYGILDGSINYETDNWRISIFGKNLTDESYLMHTLDVGGGYDSTASSSSPIYTTNIAPGAGGLWTFGTMNRPRYFGAEVQYKF